MTKPKVCIVCGTRPEAIKLAPVILAFQEQQEIACHVCVAAQHREMLDQILSTFEIRPDTDLNIMTPNQDLAPLTARLVCDLDATFSALKPNLVLVQGDTTSTFCAALSAFYNRIPVGHVEAGLRTGNLQSPWPEEANRTLTSRLASIHFCPTAANKNSLLAEGVSPEAIEVTGNTVIDALLLAVKKLRQRSPAIAANEHLLALQQIPDPLVLITAHRRENLGSGLRSICHAILQLALRFPEIHFIYPVHLNPNVRQPVQDILGRSGKSNVHLLSPLPYLPFVKAMQRAVLILTDSGGIQEEAPSLGRPVLVMRETTERPEAIEAGTARLVGTDAGAIVQEATRLLTDPAAYRAMATAQNPYGDGRAALRITRACGRLLGRAKTHD